ncbi:hypothetical protein OAG24_01020 [bacterium]|nr:hypothetical protein [bacterium]
MNYWHKTEEEKSEESGKIIIHASGQNKDGKTVFVSILHYMPHIILELPIRSGKKKIDWSVKANQRLFYNRIRDQMEAKGCDEPHGYQAMNLNNIYYNRRIAALKIWFPTMAAIYGLQRILKYKFYVKDLGEFKASEIKIHEQNIDPLIKFTALKQLELSGWIKVKEIKRHEGDEYDSGFSTSDIDLYAHWKDVEPYDQTENIYLYPKYCSFDIECYSVNHNAKLPDPAVAGNVINMIGLTFGRVGKPERKKIVLTLYDPLDSDGIITLRYKSEADLLLGFRDIILKENPDLFIGYNIVKFDWRYMIIRSDQLGIYNQFAKMSKLIGVKAHLYETKWESSAYGKQDLKTLDCHGRYTLDVMVEVQRNFKLSSYSLNNVSSTFLGTKKDPVSARQMFLLYQVTIDTWDVVKNYIKKSKSLPVSSEVLKQIKDKILNILTHLNSREILEDYRNEIINSSENTIIDTVRKSIQIILKYCSKDTMLPIDLCEKLVLIPTSEEMSNVACVPTFYLQTRGQQIKVLAQLYRMTQQEKFFIPYNARSDKDDEKYEGAVVFRALAGIHNNVSCEDFASLYPTIMISNNLCYSTLVADNDPIPDSECHVKEWSMHRGCNCPEDKKDRKVKKGEERCENYRKRFRRVQYVFNKDGTIERKFEGILPRLLRNLLSSRKKAKKAMYKVDAKLNMNAGTADKEDLASYQKCKFKIIKKGSLSPEVQRKTTVKRDVLDARQKALKVSANSMYGFVGAIKGYLPLKSIAAAVTSEGRFLITSAAKYIEKIVPCAKLVYGDTDSCMFTFEGKTLKESFDIAKESSMKATHYLKCHIIDLVDEEGNAKIEYKIKLIDGSEVRIDELVKNRYYKSTTASGEEDKFNLIQNDNDKVLFLRYEDNPVDLEFENMYGNFLLLTKKRYIAHVVTDEGEIKSTTKKGVVEARRDNCNFLRESYRQMCNKIFDCSESEVMNVLYDRVNALFTRQIPSEDFVIYMGIKTITEYAENCKEVKKDKEKVKVYLDEDGKEFDPQGWDDPRLKYRNVPQCILARKMIARGEDIPPNSRLEYLYLEDDYAQHQGEKAEDYTYFIENRDADPDKFKIDNLHYLEKQFKNPMEELIRVRFPKDLIPYEDVETRFERLYLTLEPLHLTRMARINSFTKLITEPEIEVENSIVGWDVFQKIGVCDHLIEENNKSGSRYTIKTKALKKRAIKVEYILESSKIYGPENPNEINIEKYSELIEVCKKIKADTILHKIYKKYGLRKRSGIRPTRTGQILTVNTNVVFVSGEYKDECGLITFVKDLNPPSEETLKKQKRLPEEFRYTVAIKNGEVVCDDISRPEITTYHIRDVNLMQDILRSRQYFKEVISELDNICKNL